MTDSNQHSGVPPLSERVRRGITSTKRAHVLDGLDALDSLIEQLEAQERERDEETQAFLTRTTKLKEQVQSVERQRDEAQKDALYIKEQYEDAKQQVEEFGSAAIREAARCNDFRKRREEAERELALERDRANGLLEQLEASDIWRQNFEVGAQENQRLKEQLEGTTNFANEWRRRYDGLQEQWETAERTLAVSKEIGKWALETKRCDEPSPQGDMLCDREPGHEGVHVNWQGAEWNPAKKPDNCQSWGHQHGECSCFPPEVRTP